MNITAESYGRTILLNLKGELTEDSLGALGQAIDRHLEGREVIDIVLNMEAITFVDSLGLEFLMDLQDRLAERLGQVKLIKPDENVRKIMEITRLGSSFETFKDVPDAIKAIQT